MELTLYELYQKMLAHMGPTNWWPVDSKVFIMIEAVLMENTTEANATRASQLIREATAYDFECIVQLDSKILEDLVRPAGFMKNKSRAIQGLAQWYLDHDVAPKAICQAYGSRLREVLLGLHGVGPETADVLLTYIFDQPQFVADKYARTLFGLLGVEGLRDYQTLAKRLHRLPEPFTFADAQEFHGLIDEFGKAHFRPMEKFETSFLARDRLKLEKSES